ncbi:hypothetical protein JCM30471_02500 [Desulfuromonas carbonis]|uniref:hypothetical protein n=1 Tax=Desulfuromonas sp. DDH964 TaxID=1823759 RepID=UPI0012F84641|nr:hypothetical protein [Desulfuromonas sp. DDH964]
MSGWSGINEALFMGGGDEQREKTGFLGSAFQPEAGGRFFALIKSPGLNVDLKVKDLVWRDDGLFRT